MAADDPLADLVLTELVGDGPHVDETGLDVRPEENALAQRFAGHPST